MDTSGKAEAARKCLRFKDAVLWLLTATIGNATQHQGFLLTEPDCHFFQFSPEFVHWEVEGVNER